MKNQEELEKNFGKIKSYLNETKIFSNVDCKKIKTKKGERIDCNITIQDIDLGQARMIKLTSIIFELGQQMALIKANELRCNKECQSKTNGELATEIFDAYLNSILQENNFSFSQIYEIKDIKKKENLLELCLVLAQSYFATEGAKLKIKELINNR